MSASTLTSHALSNCEIQSPSTISWMLGLPVELFGYILADWFGDYFKARRSFVTARSIAMAVCRGWYGFIANSPNFWSDYIIKAHKPQGDVDRWSGRFGDWLTRFRAHLTSVGVVRRGRTSIEDCVSFIVHHIHRVQTLSIESDDDYGIPLARAPHLHSLTFRHSSRVISTRPRRPFPPIFYSATGIPSLRILRVTDFAISWSHTDLYLHLTMLVLTKLYGDIAPTVAQLRAVLVATPALVRLSLRHIACLEFSGPVESFVLASVTDLDLCFCGDRGLSAIVFACRLPALSTVSITFESLADVYFLLQSHKSLSGVLRFHASGLVYFSQDLAEIFEAMPSLVLLDIFDGGRDLFDAINMSYNSASTVLCPLLEHISVTEIPLRALYEFVVARRAYSRPLKTLQVHFIDPIPDCGFYYEWLDDHIPTFEVNPHFEWAASWCDKKDQAVVELPPMIYHYYPCTPTLLHCRLSAVEYSGRSLNVLFIYFRHQSDFMASFVVPGSATPSIPTADVLPLLPVELLTRILSAAMDNDDLYEPDVIIRTRNAIRLAHSVFKDYADRRPEFWSHVLVTPLTRPVALGRALKRTRGAEFCVTIRLDDAACCASVWERDEDMAADVHRLMHIIGDFSMRKCYSMNVLGVTARHVSLVLLHLEFECTRNLEDLTITFGTASYASFEIERRFLLKPKFDPHAPFTGLSILSDDVPTILITHVASDHPSLRVQQPSNRPMTWLDLVRFCEATPTLYSMALDNIHFSGIPNSIMIPLPLNVLHSLEVDFRGNRAMAVMVSRLNIPSLLVLKMVVRTDTDILCWSHCVGLLMNVQESNWSACPSLERLALGAVPIDTVISVLEDRANMGYKSVSCVEVEVVIAPEERGVLDCDRAITPAVGGRFHGDVSVRSASVRTIRNLPLEILTRILLENFGRFFFAFRESVKIRGRLRLVCRAWYHLVLVTPSFWTTHDFVPFRPSLFLQQWRYNIKAADLALHIVFDSLTLYAPAPTSSYGGPRI
ncbi:hypothetical protein DFH06DRAFT_1154100, partial [Mycena polygramma]